MTEARAIWTDKERFLGEATSEHAVVMDAGEPKTRARSICSYRHPDSGGGIGMITRQQSYW